MEKTLLIVVHILLLPYGLSFAAGAPPAAHDYEKANKLFAAAKYQEALPLYQKALVAPQPAVPISDIYTRIGDTYFRLSKFRNALDAYRSAIRDQKSSERPQTQYWIGFCCFLIGRDEEAVNEFLKIPQFYADAGMWVTTAYYWAGRASERMGRKEQAAEYYKKAGGGGRSTQGRFAMKKAEAVKKK